MAKVAETIRIMTMIMTTMGHLVLLTKMVVTEMATMDNQM